MPLLAVKEVVKDYEGVRALNGVSLQVEKGVIKGLIGPNGAGKSTMFHLISGMEKPTSGKIAFRGVDIAGKEPHEISGLGMGRTFQTVQTWGNMTAVENVMVGMHRKLIGGILSCGLWLPWIKREEKEVLREAFGMLEFLGLSAKWKWPAFQLSYGEQKILEIGRALATGPELILLDEPAAGLTPQEVQALAEKIQGIRERGTTIFVVEHHMGMVMEIADEIAVLNHGELIAEGRPEAIRDDPRVIRAYLKGTVYA